MNDASLVSTVMARVATDGKTARRLADGLAETLDPGQAAIAAFEARDGGWTVEIYFAQAPDAAALRRLVGDLAGDAARDRLAFETVAARDWVAASLEGLQPVEAGRFFLHGAHHRDRGAGQPHRHRDRGGARLRHRTSRHHARMPAGAGRHREGAPPFSLSPQSKSAAADFDSSSCAEVG